MTRTTVPQRDITTDSLSPGARRTLVETVDVRMANTRVCLDTALDNGDRGWWGRLLLELRSVEQERQLLLDAPMPLLRGVAEGLWLVYPDDKDNHAGEVTGDVG